ncbi:MAG: glycosyltransferase [Acidiferrobacterales bacterium]|nr:glycosyltransferase [Acidiferrobacterales bacterium]
MSWIVLALPATIIWLAVFLLAASPWRIREVLDVDEPASDADLSDIAVLIPARNEADTIVTTLHGLDTQGRGLKTVLVDDQSSDATSAIARRTARHELRIVAGQPLPPGWAGKLWALEQGRMHLDRPLTLLLDADIDLAPGLVPALREKMQRDQVQFVSVMATLRMRAFWEKLLMPAFVFFFRLLYPFRLSNDPRWRRVAAAAGGCILLETRLISDMGGFVALRSALIDDCALARLAKSRGARTWVGLTHSAHSMRSYRDLGSIWNMVARSAFTQLGYSTALLLACTLVFATAFWLPWAALSFPNTGAKILAGLALVMMVIAYLSTLRFYGLSSAWALAMPLIGTLYLAMTWTSAIRYWRGQRSRWKDRVYTRTSGTGPGG